MDDIVAEPRRLPAASSPCARSPCSSSPSSSSRLYLVFVAVVRRARRAAPPSCRSPARRDATPEDTAIREAVRAPPAGHARPGRHAPGQGGRWSSWSSLTAITTLAPEVINGLGALGVALGAAIGAALGFGAQQLVRDYLNGILILGENPFSVGDVVALAGIRGTVEEVGLRRTIVRDADGVVHSVPNGEILVASNFTRTYARLNERFAVAAGTDIARATAVLGEACAALAAADELERPLHRAAARRPGRRRGRRGGRHPDPRLGHRPARRSAGGRRRAPAPRPRRAAARPGSTWPPAARSWCRAVPAPTRAPRSTRRVAPSTPDGGARRPGRPARGRRCV